MKKCLPILIGLTLILTGCGAKKIASVTYFVDSKRYNSNGSRVFIPILLATFVVIATFFIVDKFNKQISIKYEDEFNDETDDDK